MDSLPTVTWFWLLAPNLVLVILSLVRLLRSRGGEN